jgi:WD40 repeat protein
MKQLILQLKLRLAALLFGIAAGILTVALTACVSPSPSAARPIPISQSTPTPLATSRAKPTATQVSSESEPTQPTRTAAKPRQSFPAQPQLAFASDRAGAGDIFITTPGGEPINLTRNAAGDWDPTWSPTCAEPTKTCRIAFTSHRSGDSEIWTMDAQGRNLRNITQHPAWDYWPAWSPDGQALAFVSERDGDPELFIMALEAQEASQLTFNSETDRLPTWSPDGSRIAFAAVRNGVEEIHVINADGSHERSVTTWPLKGTAPAWSPDGRRIAFIGWNEEDRPGIYIAGPAPDNIQVLWEGDAWIGSLTWQVVSGPGQNEGWLLFSSWQDENHEIYAISPGGGPPVRITEDPAWDDFPDFRPGKPFAPQAAEYSESTSPLTQPLADGSATMKSTFGYGVNMADLGKAYLVRDLGLNWVKSYVNWETVEPEPGQFRWVDPDNIVTAFEDFDVRILMRVHGTPAWARPEETFLSHPPDDMADFAHFMEALATRYKGQVAAYEIWNEPNLHYEWGYLEPDPARYTAMLKAAYQAVKAVDPDALVISGGLATTGEGSPTAVGDLAFLQGMYQAGVKGYFDALGSHPYAFGHDPDYVDPWGLSLSRVVEQREVMVNSDDAETPIWITETGWVLHTSWNLEEHEAIAVDEAQQADYLVRAYEKVRAEWPWVQAMFLFNLDFSGVPWYPAAEPMRWYAILNPDRTPRPAYSSLKYKLTNDK